MDDNKIDEIKLSPTARHSIQDLLRRFPTAVSDSQTDAYNNRNRRYSFSKNTILHDSLGQKHPCVPAAKKPRGLYSLFPNITSQKSIITDAVTQNKAVAFIGRNLQEKTLGVPQFLLEHCSLHKLDTLILVCKYDDVLAVEAAHRLANERGEKVGETVGYKVSNEASISSSTCLIFCTPTVILHTLAARNSNLIQGLTHLILDDLHLRSMYLEVAMIALKDVLIRYEKLKLILNLHPANHRFREFFEPTTDVRVDLDTPFAVKFVTPVAIEDEPIPTGEVTVKYLEDIIDHSFFHSKMQNALLTEAEKWEFVEKPKTDSETNCTHLDTVMFKAFRSTRRQDVDHFLHIMYQMTFSNVKNVNHAHPDSSMTPLMIAAAKNNKEIVSKLISLGADVRLCTTNGWTALDWAVKNNALDAVAVLETQLPCESIPVTSDVEMIEQKSTLQPDQKRKLCSYLCAHSESSIDHKGIALIINNEILMKQVEKILVFIPGVEDIFNILDYLETSDARDEIQNLYSIIMLHDIFDSTQFIDYLNAVTNKKGKKLFFTIGTYEYSIMLPGVDVVIDSGKDRTVVFDHLNGRCQTEDCWISRVSADQRCLLANAPKSVCYRMYTKTRYEALRYDRASEIVRKPLDNLCLWIRMLAPEGSSIEDYFSLAPEQPRPFSVKVAVTFLKALEALTHETADITELGFMMLNLPIEPKLAKLVLFGVAFRCLDPVLTITSALIVQNVIVKSNHKVTRAKILGKKNQFAQLSFSDHSASLKALLFWLKNKEKESNGNYDTSFLNYGQCEMAYAIRNKILNHLDRFDQFKGMNYRQEWSKEFNILSDNFSMIRAILCAAFFPNILRVQWEKKSILSFVDSIISIGRHSILHDVISRKMKDTNCPVPSNWFVYSDSKKLLRKTEVSDLTCVSSLAVVLFSGHTLIRCSHEPLIAADQQQNGNSWDASTPHLFRVVKWICFQTNKQDAELLLALRHRIHSLVGRQFKVSSDFQTGDTETLNCVAAILREEDKRLGLKLVSGCAQRSRSGQVIPVIGNRPFFPSLRNRIRCDFCDHEWNGVPTSTWENPGSKGQLTSCLRQKCLLKEQELFRKRLDDQKAAELKSKNSQSRSGMTVAPKKNCENQTSLLGPMPMPTCMSDSRIPDQLTRNLIAGQIGRYLPPHMLPVTPFQHNALPLLSCIRTNEYVNPYYERYQTTKNKLLTSMDFFGAQSGNQTSTGSKSLTSSAHLSSQSICSSIFTSDVLTGKPITVSTFASELPAMTPVELPKCSNNQNNHSVSSNNNKSSSCKLSQSNKKSFESSGVVSSTSLVLKEIKEYSIPICTGIPWEDLRAIEDMPWNQIEESWIWFSKTWKTKPGERLLWPGGKECPWIDGSTIDLVKGNLISYPVSLSDTQDEIGHVQITCAKSSSMLSMC